MVNHGEFQPISSKVPLLAITSNRSYMMTLRARKDLGHRCKAAQVAEVALKGDLAALGLEVNVAPKEAQDIKDAAKKAQERTQRRQDSEAEEVQRAEAELAKSTGEDGAVWVEGAAKNGRRMPRRATRKPREKDDEKKQGDSDKRAATKRKRRKSTNPWETIGVESDSSNPNSPNSVNSSPYHLQWPNTNLEPPAKRYTPESRRPSSQNSVPFERGLLKPHTDSRPLSQSQGSSPKASAIYPRSIAGSSRQLQFSQLDEGQRAEVQRQQHHQEELQRLIQIHINVQQQNQQLGQLHISDSPSHFQQQQQHLQKQPQQPSPHNGPYVLPPPQQHFSEQQRQQNHFQVLDQMQARNYCIAQQYHQNQRPPQILSTGGKQGPPQSTRQPRPQSFTNADARATPPPAFTPPPQSDEAVVNTMYLHGERSPPMGPTHLPTSVQRMALQSDNKLAGFLRDFDQHDSGDLHDDPLNMSWPLPSLSPPPYVVPAPCMSPVSDEETPSARGSLARSSLFSQNGLPLHS